VLDKDEAYEEACVDAFKAKEGQPHSSV